MKVVFLVGSRASGKTYSINKYLEEVDNNKLVIDTGPIMRNLHKYSGTNKNMADWVKELENEYGQDVTSEIIAKEIENRINNSLHEEVIIIGYRTFESIKYLINKINIEEYIVLYIDGPISLLYENYCKREGNNLTFNEFEYNINCEQRRGLIKLKAYAMLGIENFQYFYKKNNNETFDYILKDFFAQNKVKELKYYE